MRHNLGEPSVTAATVGDMRERDQDPSASTAQFRAFANGRPGDEPVPPWTMRAQRGQVVKLAVAAVGVAVVLAVIAFVFIG
jgi:hypothetical protein